MNRYNYRPLIGRLYSVLNNNNNFFFPSSSIILILLHNRLDTKNMSTPQNR